METEKLTCKYFNLAKNNCQSMVSKETTRPIISHQNITLQKFKVSTGTLRPQNTLNASLVHLKCAWIAHTLFFNITE